MPTHIDIDISGLAPGEQWFNNSICRIGDEVWMAYRREWKTEGIYADIWVVALDDHLQPIPDTNKKIEIPRPHPDTGLFEDPRLFMVGPDIYLSFIAATIEKGKHCACQGLARLTGGWKVASVCYPQWGDNVNDALVGNGHPKGEKNWTFYEHKGAIRCIYSMEPCSVIELAGDKAYPVAYSWANPAWPYGRLSGSTPLLPYGDKLLGMFHSFLHDAYRQRSYYAGWFVFCPKENRLTHISKEYAFRAIPDPKRDLRKQDQWWKPNAIFPCGLISEPNGYVVSYGLQDSVPMLARFTKDEVESGLVPLVPWEEYDALRSTDFPPPGGFSFTIGEKTCKASSWSKVKRWCRLNGVTILEAERLICENLGPEHKIRKIRKCTNSTTS